jgi:phosphohistidine phosphatase
MELILWRHADAEDGHPDAARVLTSHGREQAEKMGDWLAQRLPRQAVVLVSPAVRAQQTAEFLGRGFQTEPLIGVNASPRDVLTAARWSDAPGTVLVVGHQPTLGRVAAMVMTGDADEWAVDKAAIWWFSRSAHGVWLRASLTPELVLP